MKFLITIDWDRVNGDGDAEYCLAQLSRKINNQLAREPGCLCDHPESDDLIYNRNGNRVGTITLAE
jgi:hypothetical protein